MWFLAKFARPLVFKPGATRKQLLNGNSHVRGTQLVPSRIYLLSLIAILNKFSEFGLLMI